MFNVCPSCGMYEVDKKIEIKEEESLAICSHCQYAHPFKRLPLLFLTGSSGSGKSTIGLRLQQSFSKILTIENDILPFGEISFSTMKDLTLRVAKNIAQNGKPVLQVGCNIPEHFKNSPEREYFEQFHYLALVCDNDVLIERLKARPEWRGSNKESYWTPQVEFNQWFKDHHDKVEPKIDIIDTTNLTVDETEELVKKWIESRV